MHASEWLTANGLDIDDEPRDDEQAREFINLDTGDVPCSRYVPRNGSGLADLAILTERLMADLTGEPVTFRALESMVSLIVNDSDDIGRLLVEHGPEYDIDPSDYLSEDELEATRERLADEEYSY